MRGQGWIIERWEMKSDAGLIMLAIRRLPAGVAYLSFCPPFVSSKVYWAKPGRAYAAPDSMHAFSSPELGLEVTLCSLVTSRGFWSEFPTVLDICFVSGRGSRMWRIPQVMFLSCGCTHVSVDTDRPGNTVLTLVHRVFWIKFIPWLRLNSVFPSIFVSWSLSGNYC